MNQARTDRLSHAVTALRASLLVVLSRLDDLGDIVNGADPPPPAEARDSSRALRVDRLTFTVTWRGRRCELGATMAFEVLARLAACPGRFVPADRLIEELWPGRRSYSTLRSTVCRLKAALKRSGMGDLADLLDGHARGHYRLRDLPA